MRWVWHCVHVTYHQLVSDVAQAVEAIGAGIMVLGGAWALIDYATSIVPSRRCPSDYRQLRHRLGQAILLGLEVLIIGDIVRTIIVDPTVRSVAVLGMVVLIRIVLSFSLEVEIDGAWPLNRWRLAPKESPENPPSA